MSTETLASPASGILLVDKPKGITSFTLVGRLRRLLGVKKIGHAGTLDPFATGVMVMLIGREYTRLSDQFLHEDKEYLAELYLGASTDTYDSEGKVLSESSLHPTLEELEAVIEEFQGQILQTPPMYSAKKVGGRKLCDLARQGKEVERKAQLVEVKISLLSYNYPKAVIRVAASKGTYIRSLGHDIGERLGCGAHLSELRRLRSGGFSIEDCIDGNFEEGAEAIIPQLRKSID